MLEAWPRSRRSILIQGEELSVDDSCVVIIQSLEDQVCGVSTVSTSTEVTSTATEPVVVTSVTTVTISTFVITVVAVLIIAVLATVAIVIAISIRDKKIIQNLK